MFVKVKCYKGGGAYFGGEYCYETSLPLETGDQVIAPTAREARQRAIVTAVKVGKPPFPCKSITEYDPEWTVTRV